MVTEAITTGAALHTRRRRTLPGSSKFSEIGPTVALLGPAIVLETAIFFIPLAYIAYQSFFDWQPGLESAFVGIDNYVQLFSSADFWQVVSNQMFYLVGIPLYVFAPLFVAFALRERVAGSGFFRSVYFLPAVMSPAIVGLVFKTFLAQDGPFNSFLNAVGLPSVRWLTDADLVKPVIVCLVLWAGFGTGVLIFSAAMSSVPTSIFEAARLDGASFWAEFWHIAVPSVRSTITFWTMFQIVSVFLFMFGWVYVLTGGGPGLASATMDFSIYQTFMRFGFFGLAAAESVVLIALIVLAASIFGIGRFVADLRANRRKATSA
jgi:multiple sugar transport system permease protein